MKSRLPSLFAALTLLIGLGSPLDRVRAQPQPSDQGDPAPVLDQTLSSLPPLSTAPYVLMSEEAQASLGESWPSFEPQGAQWTLWAPSSSVTFTVGYPALITVRISTDEGGFITSTARFVLAVNNIIQPEVPAMVASVVGTSTLDLTADIGNTPSGSLIRFRINRASDNSVVESPIYGIERHFRALVPRVLVQPPAPQFTAAADPCAAQNTPTTQLISQTVFYTPATTLTNSWFYAMNPNPNGVVQVQLRGYTAGGQLQVWYENPDCNNTLMMRPIGFGPGPFVTATVSGVPQGRVYFRVASPSPPPAFGIAWQAWAANNTPCTPWSLPVNTTLHWTARNRYDFFALNFASSDIIRIYATHPLTGGQFQVRTPISSGCDPITSTSFLAPNFGSVPSPNAPITFTVGLPQGGNYFLRVSTNPTQPGSADYRVSWEPVRINRGLFSTNPNQPQGCNPPEWGTPFCLGDLPGSLNRPPGSTIYFYWFRVDRTHNGTQHSLGQLTIQAIPRFRCNQNGNPATVAPLGTGNEVPLPTSPYGVIALTFSQPGGFDITIRARSAPNTTPYFEDGKPVEICPQ